MRSNLHGILVFVAIMGGIFGCLGIFLGLSDWQIRAHSTETPRDVTAAELYASGPGDNAHIRLRLFALGDSYVYSEEDGKWTAVWLAVYPSEVEKNIPPKLILRSNKVRSDADVQALANQTEFTGILLTSVPMHGADSHAEMRQQWPGVDWDHVMMLQEGRPYPSAAWVNGFLGGGIALIVLALICTVGSFLIRR